MRNLLRRPALGLLLSYLLLSIVPFAPLLMGKPVDAPLQLLGVETIAWLAAWAVFKRPAWFHWLLLPAFLALPTELYLITYYGQGISTHHLGIIAETSPQEALEFLGSTVWLLIIVMVAVILWWALTLRAAARTRELDWDDQSRWIALAVLCIGAALWGYGAAFGIAAAPGASASASASAGGAVAGAWSSASVPALPRAPARPSTWKPSPAPGPSACSSAATIFTRSAATWPNWASAAPAFISAPTSRTAMRNRKPSSS